MTQPETDKNERFLNLLSILNEDYYYFLASNILGKLPSPFNRQALNRSILSFFLNSANFEAQISSIEDKEKQILAVAYLLNGVQDSQYLALYPELPYYLLSLKLENLCDRLLLFKVQKTYILNPLLESFIETFIASSKAKLKSLKEVPFADANTVRAIFNLLINGSVPQREANLHHFIKSGRLEAVFPRFEESQMVHIFELYKNLALQTKTIERNAEHSTLNLTKCRKLLEQNNFDLNMCTLEIKNGDSAAVAACKALAVLKIFPLTKQCFTKLLDSLNPGVSAGELFEDLQALGLVQFDNDTVYFNEEVLKPAIKRSALTISTDLTVSYYGTPEATDILFLFANIQTCDNLVVYAITKDSFARALDFGLSKKTIEDYLNNDLANAFFDQWEDLVSRIKLYDGIVLRCTKDVAVIVKGIPEISDHIMKEFPENLFLMRRSTLHSWGKALAKAIDLEALPAPIAETIAEFDQDFISNESYSKNFMQRELKAEQPQENHSKTWENLQTELLSDAKKKGCLSAELEELINSKLIISKAQIGRDFRYAKLPSASGFDYNAKLSLIKKATGSKPKILRLELMEENLVVFPLEVVKNENGKAILKAKVIPTGEERNIPIGSVFKVSQARSV